MSGLLRVRTGKPWIRSLHQTSLRTIHFAQSLHGGGSQIVDDRYERRLLDLAFDVERLVMRKII